MNFIDDMKRASVSMIDKLAGDNDVPRPLKAAIGAGDKAAEEFVRLRAKLNESWQEHVAEKVPAPLGDLDRDDVKEFATDLPARLQRAASAVAHRLVDLAKEGGPKMQQLVADLPAKAQNLANSLSRDGLKHTVDEYTDRISGLYAELADRGGAAMDETRAAAAADEATSAARESATTAAPAVDAAADDCTTPSTADAAGAASTESGETD